MPDFFIFCITEVRWERMSRVCWNCYADYLENLLYTPIPNMCKTGVFTMYNWLKRVPHLAPFFRSPPFFHIFRVGLYNLTSGIHNPIRIIHNLRFFQLCIIRIGLYIIWLGLCIILFGLYIIWVIGLYIIRSGLYIIWSRLYNTPFFNYV